MMKYLLQHSRFWVSAAHLCHTCVESHYMKSQKHINIHLSDSYYSLGLDSILLFTNLHRQTEWGYGDSVYFLTIRVRSPHTLFKLLQY